METGWALFRAAIVEVAAMSCGRKAAGASLRRQPPNPLVDTRGEGVVRLKKESFRTWMACGTPEAAEEEAEEAADGYRQANAIVGRWKEYFEDLLNPTDMHSLEETEPGGSEEGALISGAVIAEAVKQLRGSGAPGVDEIWVPGYYLKALDVVGLSSLTRLCNIAHGHRGQCLWRGQTGVVVQTREVCSNYRGITLLSLPWEGLRQGTAEESPTDSRTSDSGGTMWFCRPGRGTMDQLFTLGRVLEGAWEFTQPVYMRFCSSGEGLTHRAGAQRHSVGALLRIWGGWPLIKGHSIPVLLEC
ncbi:hypothetical protein L3Q82_012865 [Scortum barcoo]|uniref:Uncharacterized protein n=1 Tax=Scortum barcoo TaxID=214431 RepID=A0ACB8VZ56_9TELE|nr:hypothetical protein L3Q82_012865 [Scortum barcoo]